MNSRSLAGPILAFASAAAMVMVIAGLIALIVLRNGPTLGTKPDDFGDSRSGPLAAITARALSDSYPFSPFLELPTGTREAVLAGQQSAQPRLGDPWYGQFVLEKPTPETLAGLQHQVEANGLQTAEIRGKEVGFSFRSAEFQGVVQLYEYAPGDYLLGVVVIRFQQRAQ